MAKRPAFQHQGPDRNCVIDNVALGWVSCTAYAMAMLIDAATDGGVRPKGCRVRRLVTPRDVERGLNLRQVAAVAEREYDIVVAVRTGPNAIPVAKATERITRGRGFLLQGNNVAFPGRGEANHAIYVHEVRGGTPEQPAEALVYDPQRTQATWIPWRRVLAFGAALRLDEAGTRTLGPRRLYAGISPRPTTDADLVALPAPVVNDGVELRFGALRLDHRNRAVAHPPPGRRVNVRRTPRSLAAHTIVDTLAAGEVFVAFQRLRDGAQPAGSPSTVWFGNRRGTEWVHRSGLRLAPGPPVPVAGPPGALPDDDLPGPPADDGVDDEMDAEAADLPLDVREDDLSADQANPGEPAPTSDADPDDIDGEFQGRPLTDAEVALLPVEVEEA